MQKVYEKSPLTPLSMCKHWYQISPKAKVWNWSNFVSKSLSCLWKYCCINNIFIVFKNTKIMVLIGLKTILIERFA